MNMIAQLFGILGFIFSIITYQQNTHKRIVFIQLLGNISFATHFYLLGAYTGAILNAVGLVRCVVYMFKAKKWASSAWWIVLFSFICVIVCIISWEGPISLLPAVAMVFTSIAFGLDNPKRTRQFSIPSSPLWLIYNALNQSYGGVMTESFNIISILVGMLRYDRKGKQIKKDCA